MSDRKIVLNQSRICHVVASINEDIGGPAYSVANLSEALTKQGICQHLFTLDYQHLGQQVPATGVKLHSYPATLLTRYFRGFHSNASRALWQLASTEVDLIHNHGLWMFPNLYARQAALGNRIPLLISPHGMLESWSLKHSWYKKWPAWLLYEQKNLSSASLFHATSAEEVNSIRRLEYKQPIALIPHGISVPQLARQPTREVLTNLFPELSEKKWLLFLSRIHPKKGLDNLLYVWQKLAYQFPDWHLLIAGPDLIGYQTKLQRLTAELDLEKRVTFTGMLSGQSKASALSNADLLVLPTHSENFGMVIAESLAHAVPVITTKEAPWEDLLKYGCGWWIEDNQQALATALVEGMQLSDGERKEIGMKGRLLVKTKYSWDFIAEEMSKMYRWILGGGTAPSCVHFHTYR